MKSVRTVLPGLTLMLLILAVAPHASARTTHVRWDIATVPCTGPNNTYPCTLNPGGRATAMAVDCSIPPRPPSTTPPFGCTTITLTGSGTFVVRESRRPSRHVTGGGTWKVVAADGKVTDGTYVVTELVHWEKSEPLWVPECVDPTCETTDNIGDIRDATGGLAVVRVAYSDGTKGVLTLACTGLDDPFAITEGALASKSVKLETAAIPGVNIPPLPPDYPIKKVLLPVMFWNPGVFKYNVEFHIEDSDDDRDTDDDSH